MVGKTRANELNREKKLKEMREYCFFLLLLLLSRTDCVRSERGFIVDEFGEVFFFVFQTKSFCSFTTDQKVLSCHFLQGFNPNSNTTCERTVNKSKHTAVTWSLKRCSNNKDDETPWSTQHFCPPGAGGNTVVCFETKPKHVMRFCNTCYVFIALPVLSIFISLEENAQRNLDVYLQPGFWELLTVTDSYSA